MGLLYLSTNPTVWFVPLLLVFVFLRPLSIDAPLLHAHAELEFRSQVQHVFVYPLRLEFCPVRVAGHSLLSSE